jgi:hypothetical protein
MRQDFSTGYEFLKQPSLSSLPGVKTLWNSAFIDAVIYLRERRNLRGKGFG